MTEPELELIRGLLNEPVLYAFLISAFLVLFRLQGRMRWFLLAGLALFVGPDILFYQLLMQKYPGIFDLYLTLPFFRAASALLIAYAFMGELKQQKQKKERRAAVFAASDTLPEALRGNHTVFQSRLEASQARHAEDSLKRGGRHD